MLAAVGIYGVLSYTVTLRTWEIGLRMALGAQRYEVMRMVSSEGFLLAAIGITLGMAGAAGLTRYLRGMLFGLTPLDLPTFATAALILAGMSMIASHGPARRATRVDPVVALRSE